MKYLKTTLIFLVFALMGCHKGLLSISSDDSPTPIFNKPGNEILATIGFDEVNQAVFADPADRNSCVNCHGEGTRGTRLVSYADYLANIDKVKFTVLEARTMPPRSAMSERKLSLVRDWINQGAPEFASSAPTPTTTLPPPLPPELSIVDFEEVNEKVFLNSCAGCHGAEGFADPTLITYEDFKNNLDSVIDRVLIQRNMPRRGLPPDQLAIVQAWIDGGAIEKK